MTATHGWGLAEQHLALDALVAFVDGELSPAARDRAAAHIACCPACASDAATQRQARAEVRAAQAPAMSPQLLRALRSIPSETDVPSQPDELALTPEGQLVTVERQVRSAAALGKGAPLGSSTPLGLGRRLFSASPAPQESAAPSHGPGRRTRQGAGVVFSGLVLGALAIMNLPTDHVEHESPVPQPPSPGGNLPVAVPLSARQGMPAIPTSAVSAQPPVPAGTQPFPTGSAGDSLP